MEMNQRIEMLCQEHGITPAGLTKELGLSYGSISKWGKVSPSIDKVIKVADYFNVSVDYLLGKTDVPTECCDPQIWDDFVALQRAKKENPARYKIAKEIIQAGFDYAFSEKEETSTK